MCRRDNVYVCEGVGEWVSFNGYVKGYTCKAFIYVPVFILLSFICYTCESPLKCEPYIYCVGSCAHSYSTANIHFEHVRQKYYNFLS